jgi:hypothetical protein
VVRVVRVRRVKRCLENIILREWVRYGTPWGIFPFFLRGETPHIQFLHRVKLGSHNCGSWAPYVASPDCGAAGDGGEQGSTTGTL